MKRTLMTVAAMAGLTSLAAWAGPLEDQFFAMDTSGDGAISRAEFLTYQTSGQRMTSSQATSLFNSIAGADGRISITEFRAGPKRQATQRRQSAQRRSAPAPRPALPGGSGS